MNIYKFLKSKEFNFFEEASQKLFLKYNLNQFKIIDLNDFRQDILIYLLPEIEKHDEMLIDPTTQSIIYNVCRKIALDTLKAYSTDKRKANATNTSFDDTSKIDLRENIPDDFNFNEIDLKIDSIKAKNALSSFQIQIVERLVLEYTPKEIYTELKITESKFRNEIKKIYSILKPILKPIYD